MHLFKWVVPGELATSGMLREDLVEEVSRAFRTVVVLAEEHELEYTPEELEDRGVKVIWEPIEDFTAPPLIRLHLVVKSIVESEKPVLVHCSGGRGRSGTVAVAYLMATRRLDFSEALRVARTVEPGYVETGDQERVLRFYSRVLKTCSYSLFDRAVSIGLKYGFGWGMVHASRVLEHSVELVTGLEEALGLKISVAWERALYVSAVLHDIGARVNTDEHREHSYRLILEHAEALNSGTGEDVATPSAILARYHGARDPVPRELPREGLLALGVLRVADGLDYTGCGTVLEAKVRAVNGRLVLAVKPVNPSLSGGLVAKVSEKARLLEEVLGTKLEVVVG